MSMRKFTNDVFAVFASPMRRFDALCFAGEILKISKLRTCNKVATKPLKLQNC